LRQLIIRVAAYATRDRPCCCSCCCLALLLLLPLLIALLSVGRSWYPLLLLRLLLRLLRQLLLRLPVCAAAVFQPIHLLQLHTSPCTVCPYINPAAATAAAPVAIWQRQILLQLLLRL
jgi:hypothetical protein